MSDLKLANNIYQIANYPESVQLVTAAPDKSKTLAGQSAKATRYGFIDLLRGFALVVMIETHVVNSYLPAVLRKDSPFFFWLTFINGLVAPAFLFAAGFSIVLLGDRQWGDWLHFRLPFWKQMRRLGFILMIAYYSHLQGFRLSRYLTPQDYRFWARTLQVDILQCVVVSLLAILSLMFLLRKKSLLPWGAGILAVLVTFVTPWMWARDFRTVLPLSLALFLNPHGTSLFPLFPWICFVLAGCVVSCLFLQSVRKQKIPEYIERIGWTGILLIGSGLLLRHVPYTLPGYANFFTTSPLYLMIRMGCVFIICALLYRLEAGARWIPQSILTAGKESLLVYGVHLWIIFALLRGKFLGPILGLQTGYLGCLVLSVLIIIFMLFLAKHWNALKTNRHRFVKTAQAIVVIVMILIFVLH
jgi:uncharacterized membrane protein